jgi:hypothetical protein
MKIRMYIYICTCTPDAKIREELSQSHDFLMPTLATWDISAPPCSHMPRSIFSTLGFLVAAHGWFFEFEVAAVAVYA